MSRKLLSIATFYFKNGYSATWGKKSYSLSKLFRFTWIILCIVRMDYMTELWNIWSIVCRYILSHSLHVLSIWSQCIHRICCAQNCYQVCMAPFSHVVLFRGAQGETRRSYGNGNCLNYGTSRKTAVIYRCPHSLIEFTFTPFFRLVSHVSLWPVVSYWCTSDGITNDDSSITTTQHSMRCLVQR